MKHTPIISILVAALVLALAGVATGADVVKHSGSVIAVDRAAGTITLGEVGPWRTVGGVTQVDRRVVLVTGQTQFTAVHRAEQGPAYPGGFVEDAVGAWDLVPGDFVTVECRHEGARMMALKVTVATPRQ